MESRFARTLRSGAAIAVVAGLCAGSPARAASESATTPQSKSQPHKASPAHASTGKAETAKKAVKTEAAGTPAKGEAAKKPAKAPTAKTATDKPTAGKTAAAKSEPAKKVTAKKVTEKSGPAKPPAKPGRGPLTTASISPAMNARAATALPAEEAQRGSFRAFVEGVWPAAQARGVSRDTFDLAFAGVAPDPKIAELTHRQSEFVKPIWEYLNGAVTSARVARGQDVAREYAATLDAVERRYGVDRAAVLGIWGMETNFGTFTGGKDVIRSLATLAHLNYRGDFFRNELVTALVILQQGHVAREDMKGSWAGAMGQTQFMPSSFMSYAVDGDGDGRKDIWSSVPDALASTANYLRQKGWTPGLPWAVEVALPANFDWRTRAGSFSTWASLGVRRADGEAMPRGGEATLFLPAGASGPAFLVTSNFNVIKSYNSSDAYAMGVGHLGDRIYGGASIQAAWPVNQRQLDREQRVDLQRHLARLGYDLGEPDGKLGSKTREAVRDYQERRGLVPDGHPTLALLESLRGGR
ncbi:lytic murein transglycosylase [Alsobacter sp. SYSU M60028]|uniref:Lytic murein transglycosylase n=1 Tax=Alsobacter ponti TaxID=2962936 RepID=A0ABT1LF54_9HYPH|nr:lytic murein transglycosylase [Alsobacter ponti]MCP8939746.1 lytic murein transglycosylase [Alsobacter ponti]